MRLNLNKIFFLLLSLLLLDSGLAYAQVRQPLRQRLKIVSRKLEFARELQASFHDQSTVKLLNSAELKLRRAKELLQGRRRLIRPANQLINEAELLINQAMRKLLKEPIRLRKERLDRKIQKAKGLVRNSGNNEANRLLDQAIKNKTFAEQAFRDGKFQLAIKHFRQAEFQVQKSIDIVTNRDKSTAAKADDEAQRFNQLVAQTETVISKNSDPEVQKNYRLAIKLSERADKAKIKGNYRQAIDLYHQATRLLIRTRDLAEGKGDRSATRAYQELAELDEIIQTIQQRAQPFEDDERVQFFMSHIEQLQEDAHNALEAQDYKLVLLNTQYARDLIEHVQKKLRGENSGLSELIIQELGQLEVDLNDINDRLIAQGVNEQASILLNYARFAKARAKTMLNKQNYRFARESILVANRFAFAADRLIRKQPVEEISAEMIQRKIQHIEQQIALIQAKITTTTRPAARAYFDHAQRMLDLARDNMRKNYYYVANKCLDASQTAIDKLQAIL